MKKRFFPVAILLFTYTLIVNCQTFHTDDNILIREFNNYRSSMGETIKSTDMPYANISGSPYFNDTFVDGEVISMDSIRYVNVKLRYNIFTDQLEFLQNDEVLALSNPQNYNYFILGNDIFISQVYTSAGSVPKRGFFQLLLIGHSATLTKKYNIAYEPPKEPDAYASAKPARFFRRSDSYYIRFERNIPQEITLNRRRVLNVFPDKIKELEKFISDNRLNFRNEEDLIKLVEYYNQL